MSGSSAVYLDSLFQATAYQDGVKVGTSAQFNCTAPIVIAWNDVTKRFDVSAPGLATTEDLIMASIPTRAEVPVVPGATGGLVWLLFQAPTAVTMTGPAICLSETYMAAADYFQVGIYTSTDLSAPASLVGSKADIGNGSNFSGGPIPSGTINVPQGTYVLAVFNAHSGAPADVPLSVMTWSIS